jgi:predicted ATP-grasp superfamily ATP-dependent carboligase
MQDSKAAAEAVKFLDKYLGLDVDYNPLLAQAEKFEEKLKSVMAQGQKLMGEKERKSMEYLG